MSLRNWTSAGSLVVVILVIGMTPQQGDCVQRMALKDDGTYTLQNVGDYAMSSMQGLGDHAGYLTALSGNEAIVTDIWRDTPAQKWQVSKGYIYTSYIFKPLSEVLGAKVGMESVNIGGQEQIRKSHYTFGLSSELYWSIIPAEGKLVMVQNLKNDLCLESRGRGQPVGISPCRNSKSQQWAVHAR